MIAVGFAVLAAAGNALASVLQRHAARTAPTEQAFRLGLIVYLIRRPAWLGGIGALIAGFLFQATALNFGELSLVQPLLVLELPFTLMFLRWPMKGGRTLGRSWAAVGLLTAGLATLLLAAGPSEGNHAPRAMELLIGVAVTGGLVAGLLTAARIVPGTGRAVLLGVSAGLGFAFTAALMKQAVTELRHPADLLTTWPLYGMVVAGLLSLFLLQNALQSGPLVAVQPALTISDPIASIGYGVGLFGETIRLGPWVLPELVGIGLIVYGSLRLAQAPMLRPSAVTSPER